MSESNPPALVGLSEGLGPLYAQRDHLAQGGILTRNREREAYLRSYIPSRF